MMRRMYMVPLTAGLLSMAVHTAMAQAPCSGGGAEATLRCQLYIEQQTMGSLQSQLASASAQAIVAQNELAAARAAAAKREKVWAGWFAGWIGREPAPAVAPKPHP